MTTIGWRELKELSADLFRCDLCGEQATTIHLVPWSGVQCEQVLFACAVHDPEPEGYWFPIEKWLDASDDWHFRRHVEGKVDPDRATAERPGGFYLLLARENELLRPIVGAEAGRSER